MISLAISVEGQTEEEFVKNVLAVHLETKGVKAEPILIDYHGGDITIARLASDMAHCLSPHWRFDFVTSLVDFYGFRDKCRATSCELETLIDEVVGRKAALDSAYPRVFSYVQQYEFEGLLFSDVQAFADLLGLSSSTVTKISQIRAQFPSPEDINDSPITAPSKRIAQVIPGYDKCGYGYLVADRIGLHTIRAECRRFNDGLLTWNHWAIPAATHNRFRGQPGPVERARC